ncbi:LLM class flavin-dependent oxidoreductase [Saccharospirillum salsuginis]|uniref:Luciferase-like monooxygenase n=1 Tax=Saccharospirillum salsuginis TaxID=418750 RepID=A0A918KAQ4_9GAMM|nr:LLM class flavin-dependent oxidoreductase [Saccharospirillum salsuginis]GGX56998.1 alkane 1-monooxygenase [Saccharospirillum salsuginis]
MTRYSLLDLAPVNEGSTPREALLNARALAQKAEQLGFTRFWMAEHHNMPGIASAATAVALGFVAEGTERIRIGAGGVMLPNHAPLTVAEQFGTLASVYPDRIDLGLGRAPGTDGATVQALRRDPMTAADRFPDDVFELLEYFEPVQPGQRVQAVPGAGLRVPVWLLGSSLFSARLAAHMGLPFAFASHFAPDYLGRALTLYRQEFQPSVYLERPYSMAAVNLFAADTEAEARRLRTSVEQQFLALRRGTPGPLKPPVEPDQVCGPLERAQLEQTLVESATGTPEQVELWLAAFVERTGVDEIIFTCQLFDQPARYRALEIGAGAMARLV